MKVLMIIPAYNESKSIVNTVNSIKNTKLKNHTLDYVVINDGSKDNTKQVCEENNINFIDLPMNLGIGGAVQTGYKYALYNNYDIAIQFDGDGQHDASYIEALVEEIKKGYDIAIGSRFVAELSEFKSSAVRRVGINFLSRLIKLCTRKRIYDPTSGFRACNRTIIEEFAREYPTDYPEPDTIVSIIKFSAPLTCVSPVISEISVPKKFADMPKIPRILASCLAKALFCILFNFNP